MPRGTARADLIDMESINPATGQTIQTYPTMKDGEVDERIGAAHRAGLEWRNSTLADRTERLTRLGATLKENRRRFAELMAAEMGKPLTQGLAEIDKCVLACDYYAQKAEELLAPEAIDSDASLSKVSFQPVGTILSIMPWNFPFWQFMRFAAPALVAGNSIVLKHASRVSGCALAIEDAVTKAGFPSNLVRALLVPGSAAEKLVADPRIAMVTFTGSSDVGRRIGAAAGGALKKCVLELGGSDPYVVLSDADLENAASACATSRLINNGQSCIGAKRFIVVAEHRAAFEKLVSDKLASAKVGDPMQEDTELGPLVGVPARDELHGQVTKSIEAGARLVCGGQIPDREGAWYPATLLADVKPGMPAYDEELFGPVAALIEAKSDDDAIRIANDTPFGLGAAVFTKDSTRGEKIAEYELDAGSCFVNTFVRSDPRLPFGGVKESGFGRELGPYGIKELVNIKTVYVA